MDNMSVFDPARGVASTAKYGYQASRAALGLSTTTRLTAGVDLLTGATGLGGAETLQSATKATSTITKGVTGAAKVSRFAKVASFAGKAAPVIGKASVVLGAALGGWQIGKGINSIRAGNTTKGTEQLVSGSADAVTAGALAVAATATGTVIGAPIGAVALGVAAGAQAVKYGYRYRHKIASGAKWAGNKIVGGAKYAGGGIATGYKASKKFIGGVRDKVGQGFASLGKSFASIF